MTSTFDELFSPAQDRLYDVFGVQATYNGAEVTVCIQGYDTTIEQYPEVWVAAATIDVRSSEVAEPKQGDTVFFPDTDDSPSLLRGKTYQVGGQPVRQDPLSATLALTKQMVRI